MGTHRISKINEERMARAAIHLTPIDVEGYLIGQTFDEVLSMVLSWAGF